MRRAVPILLLSCTAAVAGDKPIDPVVAAAWGWTSDPPPVPKASDVQLVPDPTTYADVYARVLRGERVTWEGAPPGMPHGVYECRLENGRPVLERKGVQPVASPFAAAGSGTTPTTPVITVAAPSSSSSGFYRMDGTRIGVPRAATFGRIENCSPFG